MTPQDINYEVMRRRGLRMPQRKAWGMPVVRSGDWVTTRNGELVYYRNLEPAGEYARMPALPLPAGLSGPVEDLATLITSTQGQVEQEIADRAAASMMERIQPYLVGGVVGAGALALAAGVVGYSLGRGAR
jgi:hypothetical protein